MLDADTRGALAWLVPQTVGPRPASSSWVPHWSALNRIYNCGGRDPTAARSSVLVPKSYLPTYREFYERRQIAPGDDDVTGEIRVAGEDVPFGSDLLFAADDLPGFVLNVEVCEEHVGAGAAPRLRLALAGATE